MSVYQGVFIGFSQRCCLFSCFLLRMPLQLRLHPLPNYKMRQRWVKLKGGTMGSSCNEGDVTVGLGGGVVGRAAKAGIIELESHNQTATWEDILNFLQQPKCKSKLKYLFWGKSNSMEIYGRCHVMTPERLPTVVSYAERMDPCRFDAFLVNNLDLLGMFCWYLVTGL